jgi:hypothetical protein
MVVCDAMPSDQGRPGCASRDGLYMALPAHKRRRSSMGAKGVSTRGVAGGCALFPADSALRWDTLRSLWNGS